jgi:hypothetical protein
MGGERRTAEEATQSSVKYLNATFFDISDVKRGVRTGEIPPEDGAKKIKEISRETAKSIFDRMSVLAKEEQKAYFDALISEGGLTGKNITVLKELVKLKQEAKNRKSLLSPFMK